MIPTGSIVGRVVDPDGDPVDYARVDLLRTAYQDGTRILVIVQTVTTDDRGNTGCPCCRPAVITFQCGRPRSVPRHGQRTASPPACQTVLRCSRLPLSECISPHGIRTTRLLTPLNSLDARLTFAYECSSARLRKGQYAAIRDEVREALDRVIESQHFILGPEVEALEREVADYSQCPLRRRRLIGHGCTACRSHGFQYWSGR